MIEITAQQAIELKGIEYAPNVFCFPVQDINGIWFISIQEAEALNVQGEEKEYVAPINEYLI